MNRPIVFIIRKFAYSNTYNHQLFRSSLPRKCKGFCTNSQNELDHDNNKNIQFRKEMEDFLSKIKNMNDIESKYIPLKSTKPRAPGYTRNHFKDHAVVRTHAGNGGNGSWHLKSVYRNEFGGPDGGDGGNGGHVLFMADAAYNGLDHIKAVVSAKNGVDGSGKELDGANAEHTILPVPMGTVVKHDGKVVGNLELNQTVYVAARGGAGGKGNRFFVTDVDQCPKVAEEGGKGESFSYELELRTMADIGLIGFPNAGKSTLLRSISRARPKVASYPFTTLHPYVGMVHYSDMFQLAVADIPGLIEEAHLNKGLGYDFLRHVQRCSGLLYVIDASQSNPWEQLSILKRELDLFDSGLSRRPYAVVANKLDIPEAQECLKELEQRCDLPVIPISAKYGNGIPQLLSLVRWLAELEQETLFQKRGLRGHW